MTTNYIPKPKTPAQTWLEQNRNAKVELSKVGLKASAVGRLLVSGLIEINDGVVSLTHNGKLAADGKLSVQSNSFGASVKRLKQAKTPETYQQAIAELMEHCDARCARFGKPQDK